MKDKSQICSLPAFNGTNPDIVPREECEAIVALYMTTNGIDRENDPTWTNVSGWFDTVHVDNWFGIRTAIYDGQRHVDGIFLQDSDGGDYHGTVTNWDGNNLEGLLPDVFDNLPYLKDLNIAKNGADLVGSLPSSLSTLIHLEKLYAGDNNLSGVLPIDMSAMTSLKVFNIVNNVFTGSLPASI